MKKIAKRFIRLVNEDCLYMYLRYFYRWQLKNKLMKNVKPIDAEYKREIVRYWNQFNTKVNTNWHRWYSSINDVKDVKYIPEDIFYTAILPYYNRLDLGRAYADKALYSIWFPHVKSPVTIAKNMNGVSYDDEFQPISLREILSICKSSSQIIIKPTVESGGGKGFVFLNEKKPDEMEEKILNTLANFKQNYIIQEAIEQHETLVKLNPSSVNTVRMITFLYNNKVYVLSSHIRIGNIDEKHDHYGYVSGIMQDGSLQTFARKTVEGRIITEHPLGYKFKEITIPAYENMKYIARKSHLKFGHFRLISWDFAVDKDEEPILIEFNLRWQGLNNHQLTMGPLFGDLTDNILEEVFGRK